MNLLGLAHSEYRSESWKGSWFDAGLGGLEQDELDGFLDIKSGVSQWFQAFLGEFGDKRTEINFILYTWCYIKMIKELWF
jgi:hypothetical protein